MDVIITILGQQLMVSDRGDHGERVEISMNRRGSEPIPCDGTMITTDGISHRRVEVSQPAQVAEMAETAETVSRFVGGR